MKSYMEVFGRLDYSDHHTVLADATVPACHSQLIFQYESKLSLLDEMLALLILLLKALGTGKLL